MSSIEVQIVGDGSFAGAAANITDYSITEYAASLDFNDLQAGVSGVNFDVIEDEGFDGSILLPGQEFMLTDPHAGRQAGIVDSGSATEGGILHLNGNSTLLRLNSQKSAQAFTGTLGQAILHYMSLCGVTEGITLDSGVAAIPVNLPSWTGDVWNQLKKLMAIHQFEIADVGGKIFIRQPRLRSVDVTRYTSTRLDYGRTAASQTVEVNFYNHEWKVNTQVYPDPESSIIDRSIISVEAGETVTQNIPVDMWLSTISAPTHITSVPWNQTPVSSSVYSVVDKDGQPVTVNDWKNGGGYMSLEIGADRRSIDLTVRGMGTNDRGPYRIAGTSEDREYQYAGLHIAATGVAFKPEMVWAPTGADLVDAPADSVTTIDDPLISTKAEALTVLANASIRASGFTQTFDAGTTHINRRGETGIPLYPTFAEFNSSAGSQTFAGFNSSVGSQTFAGYTAAVALVNEDAFANQAFGGIGGARVRHRDCIYRIRSATAGPGSFSWSAESDTLFSDWNPAAGTETFGAFNSEWGTKSFEQHARMPLHF